MRRIRAHLIQALRDARTLARLPFVSARRLDVGCCGLSKTGTHSIAGLFENYRSFHHPDAPVRLELAMRYLKGDVSLTRVARSLHRRDRLLQVELESSSLIGTLIEPMVVACPQKKFILTMRRVEAWCDSWFDHQINSPSPRSSRFAALDRVRLRPEEFPPTRHDAPLLARGLLPLACYFQLWTSHNRRALATIPESRLLIVKTEEIGDRLPDIARFAGVSATTLRPDRGWLFAAPEKHRVLATLDSSYVCETARRFCGDLTDRFFGAGAAGVN